MATKPVWVDKFEDLEIASFPFRIGNIANTIFFGLIFSYLLGVIRTVGPGGFVYTITLTYVSLTFFFGYLFVIVDYTSRGYQEIPKLSANLLITERPRLIKELILISFFFSLFFLFDSPYWNLIVIFTSLIFFPIATSVVLMEESLVSALNPLKWIKVTLDIKADTIFMQHLVIQVSTLLLGYLVLFVELGLLNLLSMAIFVMAILTVFRSLGVVLHHNSETLGFPVLFGKQVEERQVELAREQELSEFSTQLYKLANKGQQVKAWEMLKKRLQDDNYVSEADLFSRTRNWENPLLAVKAGQGFIERLIESKDFRTAWNILEFCFEANQGDYKLLSGETVLALSSRAETRNHKSIMVTILTHFEKDFPNHPQTTAALLTAARFTAHDLDNFEGGREIIAHLQSTYPEIRGDKTFQALSTILMEQDS